MHVKQLIFVLKGEEHKELGRRYSTLEPYLDKEEYLIKDFKPLSTDSNGVTSVMFLLEKVAEDI